MLVDVLAASIFVLTGSIVHGVILGGDINIILQLSKGFLVTIFFIPAASLLSRTEFIKIAILVLLLLIVKSVLNVGLIIFFINGLISEGLVLSFFGDMRQNFRFFDGEIGKIYEKGLVYIPLLLIFRPRLQFMLLLVFVPIVYLSFTVSFWATLILTSLVFLNNISRKLFWLIVMFSLPLAGRLLTIIQTEKMYSISVKMGQFKSFGTDFLVGGNGLGVTGLNSYLGGNVFIENSFLNLGLWFGVIGLAFSVVFAGLVVMAIAYAFMSGPSNNCAKAYTTLFISVTINSLSNAYLFSSSILCALLLCWFFMTKDQKC
ncbi:hypothetical protein N9769_01155 [Ascidiaceihabitans sp.]|nr:hypothetical protein [Ascidiaceihabitans sp.]